MLCALYTVTYDALQHATMFIFVSQLINNAFTETDFYDFDAIAFQAIVCRYIHIMLEIHDNVIGWHTTQTDKTLPCNLERWLLVLEDIRRTNTCGM